MARMRTIKPEACTSESLAEVDRAIRWTFATLWTHCDDEGRAVNNPRLIKSALYPLDDDVTPDVVAAELKELERVGAVCMYEILGRQYLHVPSWPGHQHPNRPVPSKLPPCPKTDHSLPTHADRSEHAVNGHGALTPVVVVGGGVGEGGGEVAEGDPPPPTCGKHPNGTDDPCRACGRARQRRELWDQLTTKQQNEARRAAAEQRRLCSRCDENGWLTDDNGKPTARCDHQRQSA